MKYSVCIVLALAAVAFAIEVPVKKVEKRGILGGLGYGGLGYGLPLSTGYPLGLGYGAPLAAPIAAPLPIAPLGLGYSAPLLGAGLPLPYSYGLGGYGGIGALHGGIW